MSAKARKRLKHLAELVVKQHKHFDMKNWCGSTGCIAGFAIVEFGEVPHRSVIEGLRKLDENTGHLLEKTGYLDCGDWAQKLLGLTDDQSERLFRSCNWPPSFDGRYEHANSTKESAQVAAERIYHLIETGE